MNQSAYILQQKLSTPDGTFHLKSTSEIIRFPWKQNKLHIFIILIYYLSETLSVGRHKGFLHVLWRLLCTITINKRALNSELCRLSIHKKESNKSAFIPSSLHTLYKDQNVCVTVRKRTYMYEEIFSR